MFEANRKRQKAGGSPILGANPLQCVDNVLILEYDKAGLALSTLTLNVFLGAYLPEGVCAFVRVQ